MTATGINRFWLLLTLLLMVVILTSSTIIWSRYHPNTPIEIAVTPPQEFYGEVYVGGAVSNPGFYHLKKDDTLTDVIQAAGGPTDSANLSRVTLDIGGNDHQETPQKVNINTAGIWLLEALPGIGEAKAQAIVDYREKNGGFHTTADLMKVAGIGQEIYEKLQPLIKVAD